MYNHFYFLKVKLLVPVTVHSVPMFLFIFIFRWDAAGLSQDDHIPTTSHSLIPYLTIFLPHQLQQQHIMEILTYQKKKHMILSPLKNITYTIPHLQILNIKSPSPLLTTHLIKTLSLGTHHLDQSTQLPSLRTSLIAPIIVIVPVSFILPIRKYAADTSLNIVYPIAHFYTMLILQHLLLFVYSFIL